MAYDVLTVKQSDMVTMLIEGHSITDIAKKLNVTRNTIYAWMNKDNVKAELDRRKRELAHQGNQIILKDLTTYIDNIKNLANDRSDKRVSLAANQYLLNRIYGNPTSVVEDNSTNDSENIDTNVLEDELNKFKNIRRVK
ncbi:helix-turn-helix domain containing protein [Clostridium sporogenes]|uniref:helix-turn-helix domain-containing protein n=1 Tax=Clostridium sporogenes TaxID=1509 RepID=UPI0005EEA3DD|nr:helix-turn-helix domain-containing protein [Clostridium sporogenes]MBA4507930.1 helix-turn-helix domain-containing protein [Clostridium sporogenes]MCF4017057.1 helix-turn-helix domain containing protein [Clostridium sporogenes]MCW6061459.1 helix-turn-helix domain containing protein [Clostridium sporogenes]MCW6066853.1 helix-turn-helix domain containing protein [Clostridium sporogenes]NFQ01057.1 helix-turn-helix domain-containing protein [Clostridium sporogenes]